MRLFIGVWLSQAMLDEVIQYINTAKRQIEGFKWSAPEQLHFTLKFLGEVEAERINSLTTALKEAAWERRPFELRLGEPGRFPERGMPRILWLGLSSGKTELQMLAGAVETACIRSGFSAEDRPFKPHLTIARAKVGQGGSKVPDLRVSWQSMTLVSGFTLIESRLQPQGAVYRRIQEFLFQ